MSDANKILWYDRPARRWDQALPAGNGRLGCMQFGGVYEECWQLNEDSVWDGGRQTANGEQRDRMNPDAPEALPRVRQLLREGQVARAEDLARRALTSVPQGQRRYQPLADLRISWLGERQPWSEYRRELDLETGRLHVDFSAGGTRYTRETFVSYPDQIMAVRLTAQGEQRLSLEIRLTRDRWQYERGGREGNDTLWLSGGQDLKFCAMVRVTETDGRVEALGETMQVLDARNVVLLVAGASSFRELSPANGCQRMVEQAQTLGWEELSRRQRQDFVPLMARAGLELDRADRSFLPTDARLAAYAEGAADPGLEVLYFAYGRYLLASSSRPGSLPANLQGIWNHRMDPPWGSKFTININTEMNYWLAARTGLAECEQPLFDLLDRLRGPGGRIARRMYGCEGFCAHHNTDLWADAAPQDCWLPGSYWPMGAAWLATHLWEHYRRTGDRQTLENHYTTLRGAVRFALDFLEKDRNGWLVTNPSVSPENSYFLPDGTVGRMCVGATMDEQILRELFGGFLQAAALLGKTGKTEEEAAVALPLLRPTAIGPDGRILEWAEPCGEPEPGHRHISHLFGLFPGNEIDPDSTPELAAAAERSLRYRLTHGGGYTGWSRAWTVGLWAHLHQGEEVERNLRALLTESTFDNLMDNHPSKEGPVFQIDGNLGAAAAMADCLAQNGPAGLRLLPALPPGWQRGSVHGLCLTGGLRADLRWQQGKLEEARLFASRPWTGTLRCGEVQTRLTLCAGQTVRLDSLLKQQIV